MIDGAQMWALIHCAASVDAEGVEVGGDAVGEVSADADDMMAFVDRGRVYRSRLEVIQGDLEVARDRVVAAGLGDGPLGLPVGRVFADLVENVSYNNRFVEDIVFGLRDPTGSVRQMPADSRLRAAVLGGLLDPPTDRERDAVVAAMTDGLTPGEAGLSELFFAPGYLEVLEIDAEIGRLGEEREVADGASWNPFDGDDALLDVIDGRLDKLRDSRSGPAGRIGANGAGHLSELEAVAVTGQWTGARSWEGARFAGWVVEYRSRTSRISDDGRVVLGDAGGDATQDDFEFVGRQIDEHPETAVGFYNGLGQQETAYLPTLLGNNFDAGDQAAREVAFVGYGRALGVASRASNEDDGRAVLTFGGSDLIGQQPPATGGNMLWYHPALLFTAGEFDSRFLADATAATIEQAETDPVRGTHSIVGDYTALMGMRAEVEAGEDPRNILLARSSEDVEAASMVVSMLARSGVGLQPLLFPSAAFEPSTDGNGSVDDFIPTLDTANPVTTFLMAAGVDTRAAKAILNRAAADDRPFSDPGVAAGVDAIMATHATIMFDPTALDAVGIEATTIGNGTKGRPGHGGIDAVEADEWRRVHAKVLAFGRGQTLVLGTHNLLNRAIEGAIIDGRFHPQLVDPFAVMAAAADGETMEAAIAYAAGLDDDAKHHNRIVNAAVSGGLGIIGLASLPVGVLAAAASTGYAASDPTDFGLNLSTDNELNALRDANEYLQIVGQDRITGWQNTIYDHMLNNATDRGSIQLNLPGKTEPQSVPIMRTAHPNPTYKWQHPETGEWTTMPRVSSDEYRTLFGDTAVRDATNGVPDIHDDYMDGVIASLDHTQKAAELRGEAGLEKVSVVPAERIAEAIDRASQVGTDVWLAEG